MTTFYKISEAHGGPASPTGQQSNVLIKRGVDKSSMKLIFRHCWDVAMPLIIISILKSIAIMNTNLYGRPMVLLHCGGYQCVIRMQM